MKCITNCWRAILGLVLFLLCQGVPAQAVTISLNLSDPTIQIGQSFTMEVIAQNVFAGLDPVEEVLAFGFDIASVDPALFAFQSADVAVPFDDDSGFFSTTDVAGSVFPGLPNNGSNDPLLLARLTFQAVGVGTSTLGIASDISDPNEGLFYFMAGNADITASTPVTVAAASPSPVPEPGTWLLMGTGLLGLLGYGWRRRNA